MSMLCFYYVVLFFVSTSATAVQQKQVEIGFIISGSDDFAGHPMQIYTPQIMKIVEKLSLKLNLKIQQRGMESFYGLIWTYPGQQPQHQVAIEMTFVKDFRQQFQTWMDAPPRGILSESVGFEGVVNFARNKLFDSSEGVIHAIVALTEQEIRAVEVAYFLRDKCLPVISAIIFPRKDSDCENERLVSRLSMFQNSLTSKYKGNLAVCSKDQRGTDRLATVLFENLQTSEKIAQTCGKKASFKGTRKSTKPEDITLSPTRAPCLHVLCSFYAWLIIGGTFVALLCFCTAVLALVCNYLTRKRWAVRHPTVSMSQNSVTSTIDPRRTTLLVELSSSPAKQSLCSTTTKSSQVMSQSLTSEECESLLTPTHRLTRKATGRGARRTRSTASSPAHKSSFVAQALAGGLGSATALSDSGTPTRGRKKGIAGLMVRPDAHVWFPNKADAASTSSLCEEDAL